jgi:spore coat polysaccharide biosynthesis protein SpsF (cytidylyltransferase family)/sialic acid synthase SpsE
MTNHPYQILEVANTHGGNLDYVLSLIDEFSEFDGYGMKFQPLHPDMLATRDYEWYPVYEELLFSHNEWHSIIAKAIKHKQIWLDLFDDYGCDILENEYENINGIKLQSSVLFNEVLLKRLSELKLSDKILAINVSGFEIAEIQERIKSIKKNIAPLEIWIEVGFQSYPTALADSGLVKINSVKKHFDNPIVFADHSDGQGDDAVWLPIMAAMEGVGALEKHIKHSSLETKYDHFSSLDVVKYRKYIGNLDKYLNLKGMPFINEKEHQYLAKSIQVPIATSTINKGRQISFTSDLEYKRSGKNGMNVLSLKKSKEEYQILAVDISKGETFQQKNFRKATIATIVACRLKSSRLPKKALLPIGNLPSVQRCLKSCLSFDKIDYTILASSTLPEDDELKYHTFSDKVVFHKGDPDDVIQRYLDIIDDLKIDVIIRVTADMPFVSNDIAEYLLQEHFNSGADYTCAKQAAVGTNLEIINATALRKVKEQFPKADYSEYMTWYFQNNPDHFRLHFAELPEKWIRDYRLTLDYAEDLEMFNAIENHFLDIGKEFTLFDVFEFLDDNPSINRLNAHLTLRYKTDQSLIDTLNEVTKIKSAKP